MALTKYNIFDINLISRIGKFAHNSSFFSMRKFCKNILKIDISEKLFVKGVKRWSYNNDDGSYNNGDGSYNHCSFNII